MWSLVAYETFYNVLMVLNEVHVLLACLQDLDGVLRIEWHDNKGGVSDKHFLKAFHFGGGVHVLRKGSGRVCIFADMDSSTIRDIKAIERFAIVLCRWLLLLSNEENFEGGLPEIC